MNEQGKDTWNERVLKQAQQRIDECAKVREVVWAHAMQRFVEDFFEGYDIARSLDWENDCPLRNDPLIVKHLGPIRGQLEHLEHAGWPKLFFRYQGALNRLTGVLCDMFPEDPSLSAFERDHLLPLGVGPSAVEQWRSVRSRCVRHLHDGELRSLEISMESSSQRCRKGTLTRTPEMAARLLRAVVEERGDRISGRALFSLYSQFKPPHPVDVVRILMRAWFFRRIHRRVGYYARDYLCGWPSEHTWLHWMTQGRLPEVMHVLRLSNDDIDQALVAEIEAMAAERKRQAENLDISDDWFIWIIEAAR